MLIVDIRSFVCFRFFAVSVLFGGSWFPMVYCYADRSCYRDVVESRCRRCRTAALRESLFWSCSSFRLLLVLAPTLSGRTQEPVIPLTRLHTYSTRFWAFNERPTPISTGEARCKCKTHLPIEHGAASVDQVRDSHVLFIHAI